MRAMKLYISAFILLLSLFLFSRLFQIKDSFFYLNDMGRDSLVLLDWQKTGKPPLLGPQTSALPFNQSAFYFYLLYPFFLLTDGSPYAALFTVNAYYLLFFILGFVLILRTKEKKVMRVFLLSLFLIILHPQFIIQNRFVWNPSFIGPLILLSFFLFYFSITYFSLKKMLFLGFTLALATSLSYSVAPILIGFGAASVVYLKKKSLILGASLIFWLGFFNLPTLFFELRHHFLLTQMMLHQAKIKQVGTDFPSKIKGLFDFALTSYPADWQRFLAFIFLISVLFGAWIYLHKPNHLIASDKERQPLFFSSLLILLVGIGITFLFPIPILAHYIFGIVTLGAIVLAALPNKIRIPVIFIFGAFWILPLFTQQYFKPAVRTVSQMQKCYKTFCAQEKRPIYVSLQSGILPFHNGPEHRYLLRAAGCDVKDIETETNANRMAVVIESSEFTFGKTEYAELNTFAPTAQDQSFVCQDNLQINVLSR